MAYSTASVTFCKTLNPTDTQTPLTFSSERKINYTIYAFAKGTDLNNPQWEITSNSSWLRIVIKTTDSNGLPFVMTYGGVEYNYAVIAISVSQNLDTDRIGTITATAMGTNGNRSPQKVLGVTQQGEGGEIVVVPERLWISDSDVIQNYNIKATFEGQKYYTFTVSYEGCDKTTLASTKDSGLDVQIFSATATDSSATVTVAPMNDNTDFSTKTYNFSISITSNTGKWLYVNCTLEQAPMAEGKDDTAYIMFQNPYFSTTYTEKGKVAYTHIEVPYYISYINPTSIRLTNQSPSIVSNYSSQTTTISSTSIPTPQLNSGTDYSGGRGILMIGFNVNNLNLPRQATLTLSAPSMINPQRTVTAVLHITQSGRPNDNINLRESELTVDAKKNTKYVTYSRGSGDVVIDSVVCDAEDSDWLSIVREDNLNRFIVTIEANQNSQQRIGQITIQSHLVGETLYSYEILTVKQIGVIGDNEHPIWKDNYIKIYTDKLFVDYKFKIDGNDVYVGRAFTKDGVATIKTNDILKNYMEESLNFDDEMLQFGQGGYIKADMYLSDDEWLGEYFYQSVITYNDWSYDEFDGYGFKYPISNVLDRRQYFTYTVFDSLNTTNGTNAHIIKQMADGSTETYNLKITNSIETITQPLYNLNKLSYYYSNEYYTDVQHDAIVDVTCNDYCLYYKNKRGGWDSCLFNDAGKQIDKIAINKFQRDVDAGTTDHGTVHFQKDITRTWQLKSGRLNDEQSKIFSEHLMTTNKAYLHIFATNEIVPVNITDTTVNHLTRANNSRKVATYTLNVEDSHLHFLR